MLLESLVDGRGRERGKFLTFRLRFLQSCQDRSPSPTALDNTIIAMSFSQLLKLVCVPTELVPQPLLDRITFSDVAALTIHFGSERCSALGEWCSPMWLVFRASGASHKPQSSMSTLFFPQHIQRCCSSIESLLLLAWWVPMDRIVCLLHMNLNDVTYSSINRYIRLQCRPLLDPAVFPQLATLTAGHCLEPVYEYVLCETEGGVELSAEQRQVFEKAHRRTADYTQPHVIYPLRARPTNAVVAIQPHLPSGYLELPPSALNDVTTTAELPFPSLSTLASPSASSSSSASSHSAVSLAFVQLAEGSVELFRQCVSYLDTNSLLFGLLPAVHSLRAVSATLTGSSYGHRALVSRYGAWSDAKLWSAELLSEWRRHGFDKQRAEVRKRCTDGQNRWNEQMFGAQLDIDEARANRHGIYWAAIFDLQTRINRYLIRVMLQRKEDVLPQLYVRPSVMVQHCVGVSAPPQHGVARPIYHSPPDAALGLLLCVPPFYPLPSTARIKSQNVRIYTDGEFLQDGVALTDGSPHHVDYAGFMSRAGDGFYLYMGPVYLHTNRHTAASGHSVDLRDALSRETAAGTPLFSGKHSKRFAKQQSKSAQLTFIQDSSQLPVVRRNRDGSIRIVHRTMAECFEKEAITAYVRELRATWTRRVEKAVKHRAAAAAARAALDSSHKDDSNDFVEAREGKEEAGQAEASADRGEPVSAAALRAGKKEIRGAAVTLEYVEPLMNTVFDALLEVR